MFNQDRSLILFPVKGTHSGQSRAGMAALRLLGTYASSRYLFYYL